MNQQMNPQMNQQMPMQPSSRMPWTVLTIVIIVALAVIGFLFRDKLGTKGGSTENKLSGYQALFLTNGQVYFGKLSGVNDTYVTLKDIYYLQVNQNLQSGQNQSSNEQQPQLSLVKLGNELHGPIDQMKINRQQVLFYEDLKSDGQVSKAIANYQKNGATDQTPAANQQTPAGDTKK